jgi:autonomous glycyl radical cofactor GrcA
MNNQFIDSTTFIELIEKTVKAKSITYIDAIIEVCRARNIEYESVPELITPKMRKLIQNEASNVNMLKKKAGKKLPI